MPTLEHAKRMLAKHDVDRDIKCFGIPIQEFDREDIVTMLAMEMKSKQTLYRTMEML